MTIWAATGGSKLCSENKPPFWYLSMQVSGIRDLIHWARTPFFCSKIASGGENLYIFLLCLFPYWTLWTTVEYPSLEAKNLAFVTENWQSAVVWWCWLHLHFHRVGHWQNSSSHVSLLSWLVAFLATRTSFNLGMSWCQSRNLETKGNQL